MDDECTIAVPSGNIEGDLRPWLDVPTDDASPFVHRFRTQQQQYVYDVNTRRIVRVSPIVWDIIEDFRDGDGQAIADKHAGAYSPAQIAEAIQQIAAAREEEGLFLSFRPAQVAPPSLEWIRGQLDEWREQLILNVTEDCNFRCTYCVFGGQYDGYRTHSPKTMSWDVARPAIDEFLAHCRLAEAPTISFYGGEPFLNLALIRRCVEHVVAVRPEGGVRFSATTNGSLLRGETMRFLAEHAFLILVSLDGPADVHDRCRHTKAGGATWDTIVSNIRGLLAEYPEYRTNGLLRFTSVATRATDLCRLQDFWTNEELFTESMGLEVNGQKPMPGDDPLSPDEPLAVSRRALYDDFLDALASGALAEERGSKSRWIQAGLFEKPLLKFHKRGFISPHLPEKMTFMNTCLPGARRTFVATGGEYYACERVPQPAELAIGTVSTGVDAATVADVLCRWGEASDQCRSCWCVSHCQMGCFATVGEDAADWREGKRRACAACRRETHHMLKEYCGILESNPKAFEYAAQFQFA